MVKILDRVRAVKIRREVDEFPDGGSYMHAFIKSSKARGRGCSRGVPDGHCQFWIGGDLN
jgi:hypothetical protein